MDDIQKNNEVPTLAIPRAVRIRKIANCLCIIFFVIGLLVTANAILLPLRTSNDFSPYDWFATAAFFSRVFLWPSAVVWLALGIIAAICRRRGIAIACLVLAIGWIIPEVWLAWPRATIAAGPTFSIASSNLNRELRDATWAAEVIRKMDADIAVFQEVSPHSAEQLQSGLAAMYPYALVYPDTSYNGMAVFSKTPLTLRHAPESYERRDLDVITTVLGHELILNDVHLAPPQEMAKRRRNRWQVQGMIDAFAAETRPIMLAGDFNMTAMSPQAFALRSAGFHDAQLQTGGGRQATWPSPSLHSIIPAVRIDTVYARGPLHAIASEIGSDIGSDHRPIKTTWCWDQPTIP